MPASIVEVYKVNIPLVDITLPFYFQTKNEAELFKKHFPNTEELTPIMASQEITSAGENQYRELIPLKEMHNDKTMITFGRNNREIVSHMRYQLTPRLRSEVEYVKEQGGLFPIQLIRHKPVMFFVATTSQVVTELFDLAKASDKNVKWLYVKGDKRTFVKRDQVIEFENVSNLETIHSYERIKQKLYARNEAVAKRTLGYR